MTWRVPPYDRAIEELLEYVRATWSPLGVIASGSIVRGEGGPTSDLDVVIVHAEPWRLRDQRRFAGVPAELFVNPAAQVRRYFASEHGEAHPSTAHMVATGEIVIGHPVIDELVTEAREWLARPLELSPAQLVQRRYMIVDLLDDARDAIGDPVAGRVLLASAVERIIGYAFVVRGRPQPRRKRAIGELAALDPIAADQVRRWAACDGAGALAAALELARHVLGVDTFFEWTSERDPVATS